MRTFFSITFFLFTTLCLGQKNNYIDTLNNSFLWKNEIDNLKKSYHIFNENDTVSFDLTNSKYKLNGGNRNFNCLELTTLERDHNYCIILKDSIPYTGKFKSRIIRKNYTLEIFSGVLKNGLIENGSFTRFHPNGRIMATGQYYNNWKFGIWTTYYENGKMEGLYKYIEEVDYPIVEFEYKKNGELEYFNDEESIMLKLIEESKE